MSITISCDADEKVCCYLEDFEGRKFNTILPDFAGGDLIGLTCGYLVFFMRKTLDFWLLNPVTNNQLHFPDFPSDFDPLLLNGAILVFSPSIYGWVFVVIYRGKIWFCIEGKGVWKHVPFRVLIHDMYAFKGKVYTLSYDFHNPVLHERFRLSELRLNPDPKITLLDIRTPPSSGFFCLMMFVFLCDSLYVTNWNLKRLYELDLGEMKWVNPCEKTMEQYAFFRNHLNVAAAAVKRESWADPRSHWRYAANHNNGQINFFSKRMWYFPHECMNVDRIDD